jgi:hypothetical protein
MTPTLTPTLTPTPNEIVSVINNCEVQTLFDMGIRCIVQKSPTTSTSNDGILSILVTGGTSPYKVFWNGKQGNQRLLGVGQGSYPVTVVDYYGDYTANTICSLIAPTPTPPPTATPLPTATPIVYPDLCFTYQGATVSYGPITLTWNGSMLDVNGKPTWSGTYDGANLTLEWVTQSTRWEIKGWSSIPGWNSNQGIPVSTDTSNPPFANWSIVGGQPATTTMRLLTACPPFLPLRAFVNKNDSSCPGKNNGSITITADAGVEGSGYLYSIDGGQTYSSINIFNNLSPRTYSVVVKDNASPPNITSAIPTQIGIINPSPTNYVFEIIQTGGSGGSASSSSNSTTFDWELVIKPPLIAGQVVEVAIQMETRNNLFQPGNGTMTSTFSLSKNGNIIPTPTMGAGSSTFQRSGCNSNVISQTVNIGVPKIITVGYTDTVTGSIACTATITNNQVISGCATKLEQTSEVIISNLGPLPSVKFISGFNDCDTWSTNYLSGLINKVP